MTLSPLIRVVCCCCCVCVSFTYSVPLPDYGGVRDLFDSRRQVAARDLCSSGSVWLTYAIGMFQLLQPPFPVDLDQSIHAMQKAVNQLRDEFGVREWPPSADDRWSPSVRDVIMRQVNEFILHFTYQSNRIEGSKLSLADTATVLKLASEGLPYLHSIDPALHVNAHEAADHAAAWLWLNETLLQPNVPLWRLTEQHILQMECLSACVDEVDEYDSVPFKQQLVIVAARMTLFHLLCMTVCRCVLEMYRCFVSAAA